MTTVTQTDGPLVPRETRTSGAGVWVLRLVLMLVGAGLTVSAFGIWLVGGTQGVPELSLMKLGVSLFMLISGLCCASLGRPG